MRRSFEFELVTPLFMRGASLTEPELRATAVRGHMRWWFRAMMGGVGGGDVSAVRTLEGKLFGAAGDAGAQVSQIRVRVRRGRLVPIRLSRVNGSTSETFASLGDVMQPWRGRAQGAAYLAYGVLASIPIGGQRQRRYTRPGFDAGSTFAVDLECGDALMPVATTTLWLLASLGGIGARSRRGFGSIRPISGDFGDGLVPVSTAAEALGGGITRAREVFEEFAGRYGLHQQVPHRSAAPSFPCFVDGSWRVVGVPSHSPSWIGALDVAGNELRSAREDPAGAPLVQWPGHRRTRDYLSAVSRYIDGQDPPRPPVPLQDLAFGLPRQFRSSRGGRAIVDIPQGRRSSPVMLRISRGDQGLVLIFVSFDSSYVGKGMSVQLRTGPRSVPVALTSMSSGIDQFMDRVASRPAAFALP